MTPVVTFGNSSYHLQREMILWCEERFGRGTWVSHTPETWTGLPNWTVHTIFGNTTFSFRDNRDATIFALKWSNNE